MRLIDADKIIFTNCLVKSGLKVCCHNEGIVPKESIDNAPTVNAIPVEWIDTYCTDCSIDLRDNDTKAIKKLLEDWKMESIDTTHKMLMGIFGIFIGCGLFLALISCIV